MIGDNEMDNLENKVRKLKRDILQLKSGADTTGDSASAYQQMYDLGEYPRDTFSNYFLWDFYFEPTSNVENFVLMPVVTECWGYYEDSYGRDVYPSFSRAIASVDIDNPLHISVILEYLPSSGYVVNGQNILTVTANSTFILKSSSKQVLSL